MTQTPFHPCLSVFIRGLITIILFLANPTETRADDAAATNALAPAQATRWKTNGPAVFALLGTNAAFHHFVPGSLRQEAWTNMIAHTNGRSVVVWNVRTRPADWPASPPLVRWNTNSLLWGMKGLTALSPSWELEGNPGQVPITALTRRHGYTRGHGMEPDGFHTGCVGKKAWFLTRDNTIVQVTVRREVVRTVPVARRDYTILLFNEDLPEGIEPLRVVAGGLGVFIRKYLPGSRSPWPFFKTEQGGCVSADIPGFTLDTFKGGDSGSPDMIPIRNELIFCNGRSTATASPEMQADMDELCRQEGLDPRKYQLQWFDLSPYPTYE